MKIKHFIFLVPLFLHCFAIMIPLYANDKDVKKQINDIKTNESFIATEATGENYQNAFDMALINLYFTINNQLTLQGFPSVKLEKIRSLVHSLSVKRGCLQRVLVYIDWADIELGTSTTNNEDHNQNNNDSDIDTIQVIITSPIDPPTDNADSLSMQKKETELTTSSNLDKTSNRPLGIGHDSTAIKEVLTSLCLTEMIYDGLQQLKEFKAKKKILEYGRYEQNLQLEDKTYLILYDQTKVIRGILETHSDGTILNVKTNKIDYIENYRDYNAIWFK